MAFTDLNQIVADLYLQLRELADAAAADSPNVGQLQQLAQKAQAYLANNPPPAHLQVGVRDPGPTALAAGYARGQTAAQTASQTAPGTTQPAQQPAPGAVTPQA